MSNINSSKITNLEFETRGKRILEEAKKIIDLAIKENEEYEKANERKFYDISNLSKTTFFLKSCYNEIGYNNISCGGRVAVYWASRFFALFGFNDSDSETFTLKALDNLLRKKEPLKKVHLFTDLFNYEPQNEQFDDYFVFKYDFKDYLENFYETLCEIVPYKDYYYVKNELIGIFLSNTLPTVQKIVNSKKFIDSYLSLNEPIDAFYAAPDAFDIKDEYDTPQALIRAGYLLNSFCHLVNVVDLGAPELIVKNEMYRFFKRAYVLAFYDKVNFRDVELEDVGKALEFRLKRLVDKYVPLAKHWTRELELKALQDLVSIILDPYAYGEQISEPDEEDVRR